MVNGIVANGRMHASVLRYARSGDLLGQLRATMDTIANTDVITKEIVQNSMFDMYCSLPTGRKRFHGPDSRREETLLQEANR